MEYETFIERKAITAPSVGIDFEPALASHLFPFQAEIVRWALKRGRAAIFADCGMDKTPMQLEWARVIAETQGPVLILAPLAVAQQTVRDGQKFGIDVYYERSQPKVIRGITIANYEMLGHFDPTAFAGVVLELKRSYFESAVENLRHAKRSMGDLFDVA
jgi:hypothetical protein